MNPTYSVAEFKFYLEDTKPTLLILPTLSRLAPSSGIAKGAQNALQAAKELGVRVAEISIPDDRVSLRIIHQSSLFHRANNNVGTDGVVIRSTKPFEDPSPNDTVLVLHTSGTRILLPGGWHSAENLDKVPLVVLKVFRYLTSTSYQQ